VPAAFHHLIGFKPSKGRWSTAGLVPACRTLDCITVFTDDTATRASSIMSWPASIRADPYSKALADRPLGRKTIGVPRRDQRVWFGDGESEYLYDRALEKLAGLADIVEIDLAPLQEAAQLLYGGPWVAERTAAMAVLLADNPDAIDPTVRAVVEPGWRERGRPVQRHLPPGGTQAPCRHIWEDVDLLAFPTDGTTYRVAELLGADRAQQQSRLLHQFREPAGHGRRRRARRDRANATGFGITLIGPPTATVPCSTRRTPISPPRLSSPPPLDLEGKMQTVKLAVVGAHLKDMPLHWQLTSRDAKFVGAFETAPTYRLYAMADSVPPKPALVHSEDGAPIALEVYELDVAAFGSFVVEVPPPLAIGTVTLADGSSVKGFVAEPRALTGAEDITSLGGWRAYIAQRS
jgi:allophanate hydrolase